MLEKAGVSLDEFESLYGQSPSERLTGAQAQQYLLNGARGRDGILSRFPPQKSAGSLGGTASPESSGEVGKESLAAAPLDTTEAFLRENPQVLSAPPIRVDRLAAEEYAEGRESDDPAKFAPSDEARAVLFSDALFGGYEKAFRLLGAGVERDQGDRIYARAERTGGISVALSRARDIYDEALFVPGPLTPPEIESLRQDRIASAQHSREYFQNYALHPAPRS